MKRLIAALLALLLCFSCAAAQEEEDSSIASYYLPDGAQVFYLPMGEMPETVPDGLNPMYELMLDVTPRGDVYLIQMEGGHALASVSCVPVERDFTPEQLLALWPQIAQELSFDVLSVDSAPECAEVEEIRGLEMLHIRTSMTAGTEESPLVLEAECLAYCRNQSVTEVWCVYPEESAFKGDPELLRADRRAVKEFRESLLFPGSKAIKLESAPYTDPHGRFTAMVPADGLVIDSTSGAEAVEQARKLFIEANPEGADLVFDHFMEFVRDNHATLVFPAGMKGVMEICAVEAGGMAGFTPERLASVSDALASSMGDFHDLALCMDADERAWISDYEHALMGFWLRKAEMDMQLDLMVCTAGDWLYEVDVYSFEGDQDVRMLLHSFAGRGITYTPPVNGLE